jgi:hypothetical protein
MMQQWYKDKTIASKVKHFGEAFCDDIKDISQNDVLYEYEIIM